MMAARLLCAAVFAALGCAVAQRPLAPQERPDIVLVLMEGAVPVAPSEVVVLPLHAAVERGSDARRALLTSQWAPASDANALAGVLSLYGYRTAATASAEEVRHLGFADVADRAWVASAPEPFVVADRGGDAVGILTRWQQDLAGAGLRDRTVIVLAWTDGWAQPAALWWVGKGAPLPLQAGHLASTLDVLPTLLAVARATVPSDAGGVDLAKAVAPRQAVYGLAGDGAFVIRSDRHRLVVHGRDPLPEECPADVTLADAVGAVVSDPAAKASLYAALRAWRFRQNATSARDRLGADHFDRLNAAQGYWR